MTIAFTLRIDGRRDHVERTVQSINEFVTGVDFDYGVIIDDSGDPDFADWLRTAIPFLELLHHEQRLGLGACYKSSLEVVMGTDASWVFSVEDDTPLIGDVDIPAMIDVLENNPRLSQLMLQRPPFNDEEVRYPNLYAMNPGDYTERTTNGHAWIEHHRHFGFQPSVFSRKVAECMLANSANFTELGVTDALRPAGYMFGYWGGLNDAPLCEHVGYTRAPGGVRA